MSVYTTTARFVPAIQARHDAICRAVRYAGHDGDADFAVECGRVSEEIAARVAEGEVESDPALWPGWTDDDVWALSPVEPANGPMPPAEAFGGDYEPSLEERREWAEISDREERLDNALDELADEARAMELVTAGLDAFPAPVCGGSPSPDERPIRVRPWDDQTGVRSRPQPLIRDEDHQAAGHAV